MDQNLRFAPLVNFEPHPQNPIKHRHCFPGPWLSELPYHTLSQVLFLEIGHELFSSLTSRNPADPCFSPGRCASIKWVTGHPATIPHGACNSASAIAAALDSSQPGERSTTSYLPLLLKGGSYQMPPNDSPRAVVWSCFPGQATHQSCFGGEAMANSGASNIAQGQRIHQAQSLQRWFLGEQRPGQCQMSGIYTIFLVEKSHLLQSAEWIPHLLSVINIKMARLKYALPNAL